MAITIGTGGTTFDGAESISLFRLITMVQGLKLECKVLRLTRGRTCYAIAKAEFGFKGNKQKVLEQLEMALHLAKLRHGPAIDNTAPKTCDHVSDPAAGVSCTCQEVQEG